MKELRIRAGRSLYVTSEIPLVSQVAFPLVSQTLLCHTPVDPARSNDQAGQQRARVGVLWPSRRAGRGSRGGIQNPPASGDGRPFVPHRLHTRVFGAWVSPRVPAGGRPDARRPGGRAGIRPGPHAETGRHDGGGGRAGHPDVRIQQRGSDAFSRS